MPWKQASAAGSRPRAGNKSVRGQISAPIRTSDSVDDEFPIRTAAVSMALPLTVGKREGAAAGPESASDRVQLPDVARVDFTRPQPSAPGRVDDEATTVAAAPGPSSSAPPQRDSRAPLTRPLRYSAQTTSTASRAESPSHLPQRKRSGFRSALSKLFGRKKRNGSPDAGTLSSLQTRAPAANPHHRSDPIGENRPLKTVEPKRSVSLPVTEYDRALRSHSIGPEDVLAIQSARNSLLVESRLPGNKVGGSDPSPTRPAGPRWTESKRFIGLSPRPASSNDRPTRLADYSDDPNEIGRAITSDSRGLRRRSRSLSAFPVVADASIHGVARRRSDEIRHWRDSHGPPVMSPVSASDSDANSDAGEAGALARHGPEAAIEEPQTPIQPFTFDDIGSIKDVAGLKITEAASLESRIGGLEARMGHLEQAVARLGKSVAVFCNHADPGRQPPAPRTLKELATLSHLHAVHGLGIGSPRSPTRPPTRHSNASKATFGDGQSPLEATPGAKFPGPFPASDRPTSMSTIRGAASLPAISKEGRASGVTADHYMALMGLLETERTARQALESQVRSLSHQMSLVNEAQEQARRKQSSTPSADPSAGEASLFDQGGGGGGGDDDDDDDDDDDGRGLNGRRRPRTNMRFEDSGFAAGARHDDGYSESFATPNGDAGGGTLDDDEQGARLKSAARALSLSRLTLGRPPSRALHQVPPQAM